MTKIVSFAQFLRMVYGEIYKERLVFNGLYFFKPIKPIESEYKYA